MSKQVTLGSTARENLVKGIDILANAVVSTLGPNGRNVVIANETNDVAKQTAKIAQEVVEDANNKEFENESCLHATQREIRFYRGKRISNIELNIMLIYRIVSSYKINFFLK